MGIASWFGLRRKAQTISLSDLAGFLRWETDTGIAVSEKTALDVPAVFCAVRVIAEGCSQVPVRVVRERTEGGLSFLDPQPDHPVHRVLAQSPNGWQTSYEFREGMFFSAILGRGALAIKNVVRGELRELLPVPPGSWTVEQRADWSVRFRVDHSDKTHDYFDRDQAFFFRGPSLEGVEAIPAVKLARQAIGLSSALASQQAKLAGNGGKPSGVLSFTNSLSTEAKDRLRRTWEEKFGPSGSGGIAILDGDTKYHAMTMTSVDAQFLETRRMQVEEIGRAFRVQPIMMMQADKAATYASAEQMFRVHVMHSLMPWMVRFEQAATRDLLNNETGLRVDIDERGLMRGDFKDQAEYYTKALGSGGQPGWMTPNDVRQDIGLNPVSDAWANQIPRGAMSPAPEPQGGSDGPAPQVL